VRFGYVVDFIHWYWGERSWPVFNVADSAIVAGAVLLVIASFFSGERK
jgi:signal peptidase II